MLRLVCQIICSRAALVVAVAICCLALWAADAPAQCDTCGNDCSACGDDECAGGGGGCGLFSGRLRGCATCGCNEGDGTHCGMPAPSYPVPFATPRNVTRTNFAYPPMMPHHSLPHHAGIYSFRHGPGLSRTNVYWRPTKAINAALFMHHMFEIPR